MKTWPTVSGNAKSLPPHRSPVRMGWHESDRRAGKVLTMFVLLLPAMMATLGLAIDSGWLLSQSEDTQQVADAAATVAAFRLAQGDGVGAAEAAAREYVDQHFASLGATTQVIIPPQSGAYAGSSGFVEVRVSQPVTGLVMNLPAGQAQVFSRAVAGCKPVTAGAAVVALDPDPAPLSIPATSLTVPALPQLLAGIEVLGLGALRVEGAVLCNNTWGGVNEDGERLSPAFELRCGMACTPLLPLTKLRASDIRVVGGVDRESNYLPLSGSSSPLTANRMPVPDPFEDLPVPTVGADPINVSAQTYGGKTVVAVPLAGNLLGPLLGTTTLQPGVYDYITVVSGNVVFSPGVYIITGKHPVTQLSLSIVAGNVTAEGVMFYISNTSSYSAITGWPDRSDGESAPAGPYVTSLLPSVVINMGVLTSRYSGLNSPGSPFHNMLIYQRRQDRRPIVLVRESLIGDSTFRGTVYAKWGHVILAGQGTYQARLVAGSLRFINVLDQTIAPTDLLPAAQDVFLVE